MSTYQPIASVTLASAASSVTFSGIPQTYTDLVLVINANTNVANAPTLQFNGDTGSNYSNTALIGNGSAASSNRTSNQTVLYYGGWITGFPSSGGGNAIINIMNYSNTTTNKTVINRFNVASTEVDGVVGLWRNTSAITSMTLSVSSGATYSSGSTFNLYGVANASITNVAKATGGDSVYTDGTYWYHIFRSSGTFTPTQALTADCLVVAGGGGGGSYYGGGGGGGGFLTHTSQSFAIQAYTVTVGAGGAGSPGLSIGSSGSNSQLGSLTASVGGGYGGGAPTASQSNPGGNGGSGGGGGGGDTATPVYPAGGTATSGQGNNGGSGVGVSTTGGGGGGGGAGSAGSNAGSGNAGNGGNGSANSYSGTSVTYAGGGGGGSGSGTAGTGGTGGAGNGGRFSPSSAATSATANTGSGGGGSPTGVGGAGGSGIVIVRYGI